MLTVLGWGLLLVHGDIAIYEVGVERELDGSCDVYLCFGEVGIASC